MEKNTQIKHPTKIKIDVKRRECKIFGGSHYLVYQLIDNYLTLDDVLNLMNTCYLMRDIIVNYRRYWYSLWRKKKYNKPKSHNYFHQGPVLYSCLSPWNYPNFSNNNQPIPINEQSSYPHIDWNSLNTKGYLTRDPFYYYNHGLDYNRCRGYHWIKKGVYPLTYYKDEFDPKKDYYQLYRLWDYEDNAKNDFVTITKELNTLHSYLNKYQTKVNIYQSKIDQCLPRKEKLEKLLIRYKEEKQKRSEESNNEQ